MDDKNELPLQMQKMLLPSKKNPHCTMKNDYFRLMYDKSYMYAII